MNLDNQFIESIFIITTLPHYHATQLVFRQANPQGASSNRGGAKELSSEEKKAKLREANAGHSCTIMQPFSRILIAVKYELQGSLRECVCDAFAPYTRIPTTARPRTTIRHKSISTPSHQVRRRENEYGIQRERACFVKGRMQTDEKKSHRNIECGLRV